MALMQREEELQIQVPCSESTGRAMSANVTSVLFVMRMCKQSESVLCIVLCFASTSLSFLLDRAGDSARTRGTVGSVTHFYYL